MSSRSYSSGRSSSSRVPAGLRHDGFTAEELGVLIAPPVLDRLVYFRRDAVRVGPGILTNARHLPGDLLSRLPTGDGEGTPLTSSAMCTSGAESPMAVS
jgi:hypothetical protein